MELRLQSHQSAHKCTTQELSQPSLKQMHTGCCELPVLIQKDPKDPKDPMTAIPKSLVIFSSALCAGDLHVHSPTLLQSPLPSHSFMLMPSANEKGILNTSHTHCNLHSCSRLTSTIPPPTYTHTHIHTYTHTHTSHSHTHCNLHCCCGLAHRC